MRKPRKDRQIDPFLCSISDIETALGVYGLEPDRHLIRRCIAWIEACAQSAADAALEDIQRGRVGLTDNVEDMLDPQRVRMEQIEADQAFKQRSKGRPEAPPSG